MVKPVAEMAYQKEEAVDDEMPENMTSPGGRISRSESKELDEEFNLLDQERNHTQTQDKDSEQQQDIDKEFY